MTATSFLSLEGLTKRFGGLVAVDDVTFSLNEGDLVGIIGPNGAGKTTLFDLVTGPLLPTSGRVIFQGEDVTRLPPQVRAQRGFGRTFQISKTLTALTALENILIGAFLHRRGLAEASRRAAEVVDMVGLGPRAGHVQSLPVGPGFHPFRPE